MPIFSWPFSSFLFANGSVKRSGPFKSQQGVGLLFSPGRLLRSSKGDLTVLQAKDFVDRRCVLETETLFFPRSQTILTGMNALGSRNAALRLHLDCLSLVFDPRQRVLDKIFGGRFHPRLFHHGYGFCRAGGDAEPAADASPLDDLIGILSLCNCRHLASFQTKTAARTELRANFCLVIG